MLQTNVVSTFCLFLTKRRLFLLENHLRFIMKVSMLVNQNLFNSLTSSCLLSYGELYLRDVELETRLQYKNQLQISISYSIIWTWQQTFSSINNFTDYVCRNSSESENVNNKSLSVDFFLIYRNTCLISYFIAFLMDQKVLWLTTIKHDKRCLHSFISTMFFNTLRSYLFSLAALSVPVFPSRVLFNWSSVTIILYLRINYTALKCAA